MSLRRVFLVLNYFPTCNLKVPPTNLSFVVPIYGVTKPLSDIILPSTEPRSVRGTDEMPAICPTTPGTASTRVSTTVHHDSTRLAISQFDETEPTDISLPVTSDYLRQVSPQLAQSPIMANPSHSPSSPDDSWLSGTLTSARLDKFASEVLPTSVQVQLAQPFGKDNIKQSFTSEKCFRHILLPLFKSGFLPCRAKKALATASIDARRLLQLIKRYRDVDFRPLQGFQADWEATTTIRSDWKAMTSACLLHFDGDVSTMVRWIGGSHVNEQINISDTLAKLKPILDAELYTDVARLFTFGAPAFCNAEASEANFQAYLKYGNHKSVTDNQLVFEKTIIKNSRRGLTLIMDPSLIHYALDAHLSPQGIVDVLHKRRKPRPLSDSSFRPFPWTHAINDWTNKANEPELHFAEAFLRLCIFHWNLAISYPEHDRHTGDDDVQAAFCWAKYNPGLVAMHSAISNGTLIMNTGLTFGDNTSPSNWEPIARARQTLAMWLWLNDWAATMEKAKAYLPEFQFAPPATPEERALFAKAIPDSINTGVIDESGRRKPPTFDHHVDDNMYGDIRELLPRAVAASVIALYEIVG